MLNHVVMLEPDGEGAMASIAEAVAIIATLPEKVSGFEEFSHGPNRDFENKSGRYPYGLLCRFEDKAALDAYISHADHQRAAGMLVAACKGGADGIFVIDLEV